MKAEDTVVSLGDLIVMVTDIEIMALGAKDEGIKALRDHLLKQAEISLKVGRREVVEWQEKNLELFWRSVSTTQHDYYLPLSLADKWQAQKEKWGL